MLLNIGSYEEPIGHKQSFDNEKMKIKIKRLTKDKIIIKMNNSKSNNNYIKFNENE